jgi:hypothetical protein
VRQDEVRIEGIPWKIELFGLRPEPEPEAQPEPEADPAPADDDPDQAASGETLDDFLSGLGSAGEEE